MDSFSKQSVNSIINGDSYVSIPESPLSIDVQYKAKSSYPVIPSPSPEGTIGINIQKPTYSQEQHKTWRLLLQKHANHLTNHLCDEYIEGMHNINFATEGVQSLAKSSEALLNCTGWQVIRVEGLVAPKNFFALLANRLFPCTDFIRHLDEIDYTPAPDTFHDQVGHLPMLTNDRFAEFFHLFGVAGSRVKTEKELDWFNRIYWFTVEFGLINPTAHHGESRMNSQSRIYGAGIASSCGEIIYSLSAQTEKIPFHIDQVAETAFDIHHMQGKLFEISSFDELESEFKNWAVKKGFL